LVLLLIAPLLSVEAQNVVSRPVGFVRIPVTSNEATLLSVPFQTFADSGTNVVVTWDAASQQYISENLAEAAQPGRGFWAEAADESSVLFLWGELVLDETRSQNLLPGLNLVGYPYSTAVSAEETALAELDLRDRSGTNRPSTLQPGAGYWLNVTGTGARAWVEVRPYADAFPADDELPAIERLDVAGGTGVVLTIRGVGTPGELLEVYWQDLDPTARLSTTSGWQIAVAQLVPGADGTVRWADSGAPGRAAVNEVYGRYYLAARGDLDGNGDGIPDARARFVAGISAPGSFAAGSLESELASSEPPEWLSPESGELVEGAGTNALPANPVQLPAGFRVIYVDRQQGNDAFSGRCATAMWNDGPKQTIRAGIDAADGGDTVVIREGQYAESLQIAGKDVRVRIEGRVNVLGGGSDGPEAQVQTEAASDSVVITNTP